MSSCPDARVSGKKAQRVMGNGTSEQRHGASVTRVIVRGARVAEVSLHVSPVSVQGMLRGMGMSFWKWRWNALH